MIWVLSLAKFYIGSAGPVGLEDEHPGVGCTAAAPPCDVSDSDDKSSTEAVGGSRLMPSSFSISSENCSYATPLRAKASVRGSKPVDSSAANVTFCRGGSLLELAFRGSSAVSAAAGEMQPSRTHLSVAAWASLGEPPSLGGLAGGGLLLKNETMRSMGDIERECGDFGLVERGPVGV